MLDRKAKAEQKKTEARITRVYGERCNRIEIPMMEIPKIFKVGREAIAAGADDAVLGDRIAEYVETIRTKN